MFVKRQVINGLLQDYSLKALMLWLVRSPIRSTQYCHRDSWGVAHWTARALLHNTGVSCKHGGERIRLRPHGPARKYKKKLEEILNVHIEVLVIT